MPPSAPFPPKNGSETSRVLLIDDDEELCELITDYLTPFGIHVDATHTGQEGAERALGGMWHAVILDVMLPDADGFEVLRRIRAESKAPVLMLTRRGDEVDDVFGRELGADDYLPKPFSSRELLVRLRAILRPPIR
jgi:DNA-binding response OmpR family regulator